MNFCNKRFFSSRPEKKLSIPAQLFLPITGLLSALWMLLRIIPKPTRATYPCMKVAAPLASTFIAYSVGILVSAFSIKKARSAFRRKRFQLMFVCLLAVVISIGWMTLQPTQDILAGHQDTGYFEDPLGPNQPIGEARGIYPGRVVWVYNPDATNEHCTNANHDDAYFQKHNTDQAVVDQMFSRGILELTGKETHAEAWNAIFRYFNINQGKGDTGYQPDETLFIKINAVTAYNGAEPDGKMSRYVSIEFDTSPQTILAMLRQLVNEAGVPEDKIYIGDPMCDIWNTLYDKFYAEFPNIKYVSQGNVTGRYKLKPDTDPGIYYSDQGTVMDQIKSHNFFVEMMNADYLVNIPSMKGHRWAGVTFFAKNHFGSNTADHSWELHKGLMKPDDDPLRSGYRLYRVLVDIMADKNLGGNTLLYFMDGLWATSYEHQKPQKFKSAPFNNDWCSSLFFSLDPVAIESVCLDIMQKEFKEEDMSVKPPRYTYVQWEGIDDYLHQAASAEWWPEGIIYDPDKTGSSIASLGTHEHWNNETDMQYSRNLGSGNGIELVKLFQATVVEKPPKIVDHYRLSGAYPNPFNPQTNIRFKLTENAFVSLAIYNIHGRKVRTLVQAEQSAGTHVAVWNGCDAGGRSLPSGVYLYRFQIRTGEVTDMKYGQMVLMK
ncbi:DUF362 domain-containing protein [bacterium]|nr:DUF362 domain-containing protein [bacterium]